jgi:hypothetical protein
MDLVRIAAAISSEGHDLVQFGLHKPSYMDSDEALRTAAEVLAAAGHEVRESEVVDPGPTDMVVLIDAGPELWELLQEEGFLTFSGGGIELEAEMP